MIKICINDYFTGKYTIRRVQSFYSSSSANFFSACSMHFDLVLEKSICISFPNTDTDCIVFRATDADSLLSKTMWAWPLNLAFKTMSMTSP